MKDLYGYKRYRKQLLRGLRRYTRFSRFCRIAEKMSRESFKNTRRYISAFAFPSKKRGVVSRSGRVKIDVDEPPRDLTGCGEKRIKRVVPFSR